MEALEAMKTRRSIRKFSGEPVADEDVKKILEAAMFAPSAVNEQPWHFIVVKDRAVLNKIPEVSPYSAMCQTAALAIIICADTNLEKAPGLGVLDCTLAGANILLAAHALGLGAVWTATYPMQDRVKGVSELLKLPKNVVPLCIIPIGHPAEKPAQPERFSMQRVHYNKW
ncbi:MAG: nitroreductase family protein [Candidatus Micrarchaeota archaeon]